MNWGLSVDLPEARPPEEGVSHFRWGTVTNTVPFTVRLDGDSVPLGAEPESLVDPLSLHPGARVWVQLFARRVLVMGSTRGKPDLARTTARMQQVMTGGGIKTVIGSSRSVRWTSRFIVLGVERSSRVSGGYFQINMPPDGMTIPSLNGGYSTTVTADGIALGFWNALYYLLPYGEVQTSIPENFFLADYSVDLELPPNAVLVAAGNGDSAGVSGVKWGTGELGDYWRYPGYNNGWLTYNTDYPPARYRKLGDLVEVSGLVRSGAIGSSVFQLPVGYRPKHSLIFATQSNNALGRLDIRSDGFVNATSGNNAWFSLECSFGADQ